MLNLYKNQILRYYIKYFVYSVQCSSPKCINENVFSLILNANYKKYLKLFHNATYYYIEPFQLK